MGKRTSTTSEAEAEWDHTSGTETQTQTQPQPPKPPSAPRSYRKKKPVPAAGTSCKLPLTEHCYPINFYNSVDDTRPGTFFVKISAPDNDEEECPLTLEPIATSELELLQGLSFIPERPLWRKMTLPCGHAFSALPMLYHMCKNNMLCPCCRSGDPGSIGIESVPSHLRSLIVHHIQDVKSRENAADDQEAIHLLATRIPFTQEYFFHAATHGDLMVSIFYSSQGQRDSVTMTTTAFEFHIQMHAIFQESSGPDDRLRPVFRPAPTHRRLLEQLLDIAQFIQVSITMREPGLGLCLVDTMARIPIPPLSAMAAPGEARAPPARRGEQSPAYTIRVPGEASEVLNQEERVRGVNSEHSSFELSFDHTDGVVYLSDVCWIPSVPVDDGALPAARI